MKTFISKDPLIKIPSLFTKLNFNNFADDYSFYQGRYAIYYILKGLFLKKSDEVLLPTYHCLTMIEPVLRYGCKIRFYRTRPSLQATVKDIDESLTSRTRVVFLVHFFGIYQKNTENIKKFLLEKNVMLVEDCAHCLPIMDEKVGVYGDISIFSPRKYLSLIDGAILRINNRSLKNLILLKKLPFLRELKAIKNTIEQQINSAEESIVVNIYNKIDNSINRALKKLKKNNCSNKYCNSINPILPVQFNLFYNFYKCSRFSFFVIKKADFKEIFLKRKHNFQYLYDNLYVNFDLKIPEFINSRDSNCVFGFPVLAKNKRRVISELKLRKIQTFTFGEDLYESLFNKTDNNIFKLSEQLFFIPIHQNLNLQHMNYIVEQLKFVHFCR